MSVGLTYSQQVIRLSDGSLEPGIYTQTPMRSIEYVDDGILITYKFNKATITEDTLYEGHYMWKFMGFGVNDIPAQPATPFRLDAFSVPHGYSAVIELVDSQYIDLAFPLSPARPALTDSGDDSYSIDNVPAITAYEGYFPSSVVHVDGVETYRGMQKINVLVSPIQYKNSSRVVRAYTNISYKVSFVKEDEIQAGNSFQSKIGIEDTFLDNVSVNKYRQIDCPNGECAVSRKGFLIISSPTFKNSVERFAQWKRLLGFDVHIAFNALWTEEDVKTTIQDIYENNNLYYLLIVGDVEVVPTHTSNLYNEHATDFYYACLDGADDTMPDLLYGRIPVSTNDEAETVFDKIINYEKSPTSDSTFYMTGLHCAYFQDNDLDSYADRRFAQTSEEIRSVMSTLGFNVTRVYNALNSVNPLFWNKGLYSFGEPIPDELKKPVFAWSGNAIHINSAINSGVFYVLHRDHGAVRGWGSPHYTTTDINSLNNNNRLPVVFSMNCKTGKFDDNNDCFCEVFLKKENGGCVAIFGATEVSYSGYNDALTEGMFDAVWPSEGLRPTFPSINGTGGTTPIPTYELGQILNQGKARMAETYGVNNTSLSLYTKELFHCFGDPSLKIYTAVPTSFANVDMTRNINSVSVSLYGDTATIVFQDLINGTTTTQFGTNATYITSHPANVTVCISAHNKIPFINEGDSDVIYIQNETVVGPADYDADWIMVGSNVTSQKPQGTVIFNGGVVNLKANEILIDCGTEVKKGTILNIIN